MKWIPILLVCLLWSSVATEEGSDWPMFQHDAQHTGYSSSSLPHYLEKVWSYKEYGRRGARFVILNEKIFVVHDSFISALDSNGSVVWDVEMKGGIQFWSFPAATNNVYVGATGTILCLDDDTGDTLWNYDIEPIILFSAPIVFDEFVIIGCGGDPLKFEAAEYTKRVLCLNAKTGKFIWEFYADDMVTYSPGYLDGRIYINDGFRKLYCLDIKTGELIWEKNMEWTSFSGLSLKENIFVGVHNGVACLDSKTGDIVWHFDCGESVFETPAVAYNKVFVGTPNGIFYCVDAQTGKLIWKIETKSVIYCSAVAADGKVAFGNRKGILYIVDAESGEIFESYQLDESGITALALSDGKLFVGQENGKITCFEESPSKKLILILILAVVIMVSVLVWHQRKKT